MRGRGAALDLKGGMVRVWHAFGLDQGSNQVDPDLPTKYHVKARVLSIRRRGFAPGPGQVFGKGVYAFFDLQPLSARYGPYVIEFGIPRGALSSFLILGHAEAHQAFGPISFRDQLTRLGIVLDADLEAVADKLDRTYKEALTEKEALILSRHAGVRAKIKGLIYRSTHDGAAVVCYDPSILKVLGYFGHRDRRPVQRSSFTMVFEDQARFFKSLRGVYDNPRGLDWSDQDDRTAFWMAIDQLILDFGSSQSKIAPLLELEGHFRHGRASSTFKARHHTHVLSPDEVADYDALLDASFDRDLSPDEEARLESYDQQLDDMSREYTARVWAEVRRFFESGSFRRWVQVMNLTDELKVRGIKRMGASVMGASVNLGRLVQQFLKEVRPMLDTGSCDATKGKCDSVASDLHWWLADQGVTSTVVEGQGLIPPLGDRAHDDWKAFVDGDISNQKYLAHVVVRVGNKVVDLTAAQFGQARGVVIESWGDFRKRWQKVKPFKPWARQASSGRLVWNPPRGSDPWDLAAKAGIRVLSHMEFKAGYVEGGKLVAVLFEAYDSDCYSFDFAVDPEYQRRGYGSKLIDLAIDSYEDLKEPFPDLQFCVDAVSPVAVQMLKQRGFVETGHEQGHTLMTRRGGIKRLRAADKFGPNTSLMDLDKVKVKYRVKKNSQGVVVRVYHGREVAGSLDAYPQRGSDYCAKDIAALEAAHPELAGQRILQVYGAVIKEPYRGLGIGRSMYLALMAEWFDSEGPFLFQPTRCSFMSGTSASAQRVWKSLARRFPSSGDVVAVLKRPYLPAQGKQAAQSAPMPEGAWHEWSTIGGETFSGRVVENDSGVLIVECTDGVIRVTDEPYPIWREAQTRQGARAVPGSKGQKSVKQGRFVIWYLPRYEADVPVVQEGLRRAEAKFAQVKYRLPDSIPVLMAARSFGSTRSMYSPSNGGFIQLVPSAFDTKAAFHIFVHELAHYVHAHQIPGGFRNTLIASQFTAAGAAEAQNPSAPTEDPLEKAKANVALAEKMWGEVAGLLRKGQRFTLNYEDYFSRAQSQRKVEIIKRTSRGRNSEFTLKWLEPTQEEVEMRFMGTTKSLVPLVQMMVDPAQVSPKLGPGVEAMLRREEEALDAYNEAVIERSQAPDLRYEKHLAKWFPTSYSRTNSDEWFAELVTARVLSPASMDPGVAEWVDALMQTGQAPRIASPSQSWTLPRVRASRQGALNPECLLPPGLPGKKLGGRAASAKQGARPIRLPTREIKDLAQKLAQRLRQWGLPKPGKVVAQEYLPLINVKGDEVEVEILLTGSPQRHPDPFNNELFHGGFLKRRGDEPLMRVFVNPYLRSFEQRPIRIIEDELYRLLAHELTHAADIWSGKGSVGDLSGSLDDLKRHHHNHPAEVRALMRDVVTQVGGSVQEFMGYGMNFNMALREALKDTKWPDIAPYLTQKNKNILLKGVHTHLRDQEGTVKQGSKYKKKKEVPKAEGSGTTTVYEYTDKHIEKRHKDKAKKIKDLKGNIGRLRAKFTKDLKSKDDKTRLTALAVALMDCTYERVGNDESAKDGHFGVTGFQKKHITFKGQKAILKYTGKSGVDHVKEVTDAPVVSALKAALKDKADKDCILDHEGGSIGAEQVNAYLEPFGVSAKDIRGYHANREMQDRLKEVRSEGGALPTDPKERKKQLKDEFKKALEGTAGAVGHESATLKSQYLVPGLEDQFLTSGKIKTARSKGVYKMALARCQARRHIQVDQKRVKDLAAKFYKVVKRAIQHNPPYAPLGEKPYVTRESFRFKDVRGEDRGADITLIFAPVPRRGLLDGWANIGERSIVVRLNSDLNAATLTKMGEVAIRREFERVLEHEIAHFMEAAFKGPTHDPRQDLTAYYNSPHEVRAYLVNIVSEVLDWVELEGVWESEDPRHLFKMGMAASKTWTQIEGHLLLPNRKHIQSVVYQEIVRSDALRQIKEQADQKTATFQAKGRTYTGARRLARLWLATKSESDKEDEHAKKQVKPEPKYKPPRKDKRKRRMDVEDPDMKGSGGAEKDPDLSLNYKGRSAALARAFLAAQKVWKTEEGSWGATNAEGATRYFKDKKKAKAFAEGGDGAKDDEAPEQKDTPPQEEGGAPETGDGADSKDPVPDPKGEEKTKPPKKEAPAPPHYEAPGDWKDAADMVQESVQVPKSVQKALEKFTEGASAADLKAFEDAYLKASQDGAAAINAGDKQGLEEFIDDLDNLKPDEMGKALANMTLHEVHAVHEAEADAKGRKQKVEPLKIGGRGLSTKTLSPDRLKERTMEAFHELSEENPRDLQAKVRSVLAEQAKLEKGSPQYEEAEAIMDGIHMALLAQGKDLEDDKGKPLRPPMPSSFKALVKHLAEHGDVSQLLMSRDEFVGPKGRSLVQQTLKDMSLEQLMEFAAPSDRGSQKQNPFRALVEALGDEKTPMHGPQKEYLLDLLRRQLVNSLTVEEGLKAAFSTTADDPEKGKTFDAIMSSPDPVEQKKADALNECLKGAKTPEDRAACHEQGDAIELARIQRSLDVGEEVYGPPPEGHPAYQRMLRTVDSGDLGTLDVDFQRST